jgi:TolB protein
MRFSPAPLAAILALVLPALAAPPPARADIVVNVDQGATQPLPIAVAVFAGSPVGAQIRQVVADDLADSGLFRPLDPATFPLAAPDVNAQPAFDGWKAISAQGLVTGQVAADPSGKLVVNFRLWDVYAGDQLVGLQLSSTPAAWRHLAHKIADAIYEKLTGQGGYFDSRVVFASESGPRGRRIRKLEIMDQDGANPAELGQGAGQVFFPSISADNRHVTYMVLRPTGSTINLLDLDTGRQESLARFPGMMFAARYSPDGRLLVFSAEKDGNTDIYLMSLATRAISRLTHDPAIDTSPSFSPDGAQIVFNSDRGGSPQLYVMGLDGGNVRRISFGSGRYTTPVWSPDGKYVAFTKQEGSVFHIGVMKPDGSEERLLTSAYLDEGPTWAPNSRVIMFARDTGYGAHLWRVDLSGQVLAPSHYALGASDPSWSRLLP